MRLLILGCGSIGSVIARAADQMSKVEKIMLYDIDSARAEQLAGALLKTEHLKELKFKESNADLVIEAASQQAAKNYIPVALESGSDAIIMSVGAFVDKSFQERCFSAVTMHHSLLLLPSGAIAGIDALKAAGRAKLKTVKLISTKPPKGLRGVKYLIEQGIEVEKIKEKTTLYSGPASRAVQLFPANVNVAATVSLAGMGFEKTEVEIVCDPAAKVNSHNLHIEGEFGEMDAITRNIPSPDNPRTSYLASLSAVSTLASYIKRIWIGV